MGETAKTMTNYTIEINWVTDFYLENALKKVMRDSWKDSLFMSDQGYNKDVFYKERIDAIADILLQITNCKYGNS